MKLSKIEELLNARLVEYGHGPTSGASGSERGYGSMSMFRSLGAAEFRSSGSDESGDLSYRAMGDGRSSGPLHLPVTTENTLLATILAELELDACTDDDYRNMYAIFEAFSNEALPLVNSLNLDHCYEDGGTALELYELLSNMRTNARAFVAQLSHRVGLDPIAYVLEQQRKLCGEIAKSIHDQKITPPAVVADAVPMEVAPPVAALEVVAAQFDDKAASSQQDNLISDILNPLFSNAIRDQQQVHKPLEIYFAFDVSASFDSHLKVAQQQLSNMVDELKQKANRKIRFRLCTYSDYSDDPNYSDYMDGENKACRRFSWTENAAAIKRDIESVNILCGYDDPEAVELMLEHVARDEEWGKDSQKLVVWLNDAPAHGYYAGTDHYPNPQDLPVQGVSLAAAVKKIKEKDIAIYPLVCGPCLYARKLSYAVARLTEGTCAKLEQSQTSQLCALIMNKIELEHRTVQLYALAKSTLVEMGFNIKNDGIIAKVFQTVANHPAMKELEKVAADYKTIKMEPTLQHRSFVDSFDGNEAMLREFVLQGLTDTATAGRPQVVHSGPIMDTTEEDCTYRSLACDVDEEGAAHSNGSMSAGEEPSYEDEVPRALSSFGGLSGMFAPPLSHEAAGSDCVAPGAASEEEKGSSLARGRRKALWANL